MKVPTMISSNILAFCIIATSCVVCFPFSSTTVAAAGELPPRRRRRKKQRLLRIPSDKREREHVGGTSGLLAEESSESESDASSSLLELEPELGDLRALRDSSIIMDMDMQQRLLKEISSMSMQLEQRLLKEDDEDEMARIESFFSLSYDNMSMSMGGVSST